MFVLLMILDYRVGVLTGAVASLPLQPHGAFGTFFAIRALS
jgi:hypothetical protein